jgi:hypothetical protein
MLSQHERNRKSSSRVKLGHHGSYRVGLRKESHLLSVELMGFSPHFCPSRACSGLSTHGLIRAIRHALLVQVYLWIDTAEQ